MRWLRALLGLHEHKWKIVSTVNVFGTSNPKEGSIPTHIDYVLQCEHCGDIKRRRT